MVGARHGGNLFGVAVEADAAFGRFGRRLQHGEQFSINVPQGGIMFQQRPVNLGQPLEDGGVGGQMFAHLDKRPHHINRHVRGAFAVENVRRHERPVFGEGPRAIRRAAMSFGTGRKLRPIYRN